VGVTANIQPGASVEAQYEIFMSYAHGDAASVEPIVDALVDAGLRVWFDTSAVEDFSSISRGVESGLRHSKALLAFYSTTYPTRRASQWSWRPLPCCAGCG
jgi:hypothetical protein